MNLKSEKRLAKFFGVAIAFLTLVIWASSVSPAGAQTCQTPFGDHIAGVYFPKAQPGWDLGGPQMPCWLEWLPTANVPGGGVWGRRVPGGYEPVMDAHGQPLSGRQRIERGAGITLGGAVIGRAVGGPTGGWIGLAGGVAAALINDSRYRGRDEAPAQPQPTQTPVPAQPSVEIPPSLYPPDYQPPQAGPTKYGSRQREIKYQVVNPWPVDAVVYYDSNPDETWVARRNSSSLLIPRREGTLMAQVATTANGGFIDEEVVVRGDGKKFIIPDPE